MFKGGFVLRHVHGHLRFSRDIDATRHEPARHKLDAEEVAEAIRQASIRNVVKFSPEEPATDSGRSLDFDSVKVTGETFPNSAVQVEISYREAVVLEPLPAYVGNPFYAPIEVLTMHEDEMAAEKLRALAQRLRPTDLADLAVILSRPESDDKSIGRTAIVKFEQVKQGRSNRRERIEQNLAEMADTYDDVIPGLFPQAPSYREAMDIVWPRIATLIL